MMLIRLQRKSARAEVQETCLTDHAHAAVRACAPRGIFCKGFAPWAHDRSIAGAPRGEMKSVDLPEFIRNLWFLYDFSMSARAGLLRFFVKKKHLVFYVFTLKCLQAQRVWYDFDMIRHESARVDFVVFFCKG